MDLKLWATVVVFIITYTAIAVDKVHKTLVALAGAMLVLLLGIIPQEEAFAHVDWNVIFLLAGMMVIAHTLQRTGVFEWASSKVIDLARGEPFRVLLYLSAMTAVMSAFLDNVTTVVLIVPLTLFVAGALGISPVPFLISEIMASNIGGAATLIGDPPNIIIGSASGLDFGAFLLNMGPVVLVCYAAFMGLVALFFRKDLFVSRAKRAEAMALSEKGLIKEPALLAQSLIVLALVLAGFLLHSTLGLEAATVAMTGAVVLLLISRSEVHEVLSELEWGTLLFFVGLFVLVEALVEVGIVGSIAQGLIDATGGNPAATSLVLLWGSGVASAIIDNIPYTATMVPVIRAMEGAVPSLEPLWWSLALGACFGGNATVVGASANVIVVSMAERAGHRISFRSFLKYGVITTTVTLAISSVYVWLRYLM